MKTPQDFDWKAIDAELNQTGKAALPQLVTPDECRELIDLYPMNQLYRSTINMKRYRFGQGEYRYFQYPLPEPVQRLREQFYPSLAATANQWMKNLSMETQFPESHPEMISRCHAASQLRPTPLILNYEAGGYNTLHQDLYGDIWFPFQLVILLSRPGMDFTGGEFAMVEQLPRAQPRVEVVNLNQGDGLIFTTNFRPGKSVRGYYRAKMKHGVSTIHSGKRHALGIIFHDAL